MRPVSKFVHCSSVSFSAGLGSTDPNFRLSDSFQTPVLGLRASRNPARKSLSLNSTSGLEFTDILCQTSILNCVLAGLLTRSTSYFMERLAETNGALGSFLGAIVGNKPESTSPIG